MMGEKILSGSDQKISADNHKEGGGDGSEFLVKKLAEERGAEGEGGSHLEEGKYSENNSPDAEMQNELQEKKEKESIGSFLAEAKSLISILGQRDQERMTPLLTEDFVFGMRSSIIKAEDLLVKKELDRDQFFGLMKRIGASIKQIGMAPRGRGVKDSWDSLKIVGSKLRRMEDVLDISIFLIKNNQERWPQETISNFTSLKEEIRGRSLFILRMINALPR